MAGIDTSIQYNVSSKNKPVDSKAKVTPAPMDNMQTDGGKMDKMKEQDDNILSRKGTKIGHRRIDEDGQITYKKQPSSALVSAIQLGIQYSVGRLSSKVERDVLMGDFYEIESVFFPSDGRQETPAHHYSDFRFKAYAPVAFRYFRELFHIAPDDFLISLCHEALRELTNPGASGSLFYLSEDDQFIIKTVQHKEAEFLQKLLPGYYLNLNQNKRTLLPKFFGLYCYQCGGKNIRLIVMNNLLPSGYKIHLKYDLKGSTFKRKASKNERAKTSPTLKDLDFMNDHPEAIALDAETYNLLTKTIQRDCRVLESFKIMDYSLLLAIHNIDEAAREMKQLSGEPSTTTDTTTTATTTTTTSGGGGTEDRTQSERSTIEALSGASVARNTSGRTRDDFSAYWEAIPQHRDDNIATPYGAIRARNSRGDRLLLFIGIIDILQSYRLKKKLEHRLKSVVQDGDSISVHRPSFYSKRFQEFMFEKVFRKLPASRAQITRSPSKKRASFNAGKTRDKIRTVSDTTDKQNKIADYTTTLHSKQSPSLPAGLPNIVPGDVSFMGALSPVSSNKSRKSDELTRSNEETTRKSDQETNKASDDDDHETTTSEKRLEISAIITTDDVMNIQAASDVNTSDVENVTESTELIPNYSDIFVKQTDGNVTSEDVTETSEVLTEKSEVLTETSEVLTEKISEDDIVVMVTGDDQNIMTVSSDLDDNTIHSSNNSIINSIINNSSNNSSSDSMINDCRL